MQTSTIMRIARPSGAVNRATLATCYLVIVAVTMAMTWLSGRFRYGSSEIDRPIFLIVGLMVAGSIACLAATYAAVHLKRTSKSSLWIVSSAIMLRVIALPSDPIQEVDLYRYLWDGWVTCQGTNPYDYSPQQIIDRSEWASLQTTDPDRAETTSNDLRLASLVNRDDSMSQVLRRVHFTEIRTVYPPISQAVFAFTVWASPFDSVDGHVIAMKLVLTCFDLATLVIVLLLLSIKDRHVGWAIPYAWSPLVIKEFANSGHLDSIAVFLMVASLAVLIVRAVNSPCSTGRLLFSAVALGLAFGAKLFPIVIAPAIFCYLARSETLKRAVAWLVLFASVSAACLLPMRTADHTETQDPSGLTTFLSRWEMNDLLFMLVLENTSHTNEIAQTDQTVVAPWFVVIPDFLRSSLHGRVGQLLGHPSWLTPFLLSRMITTMVLAAIVIKACHDLLRDASCVLETCFVSIAWFWMLSPTQNPWYWTWALPLVPFARNRAWLLASTVCLLYYLRFWFDYHQHEITLAGRAYTGVEIFDYVVVFFEFTPLLFLLMIGTWIRR